MHAVVVHRAARVEPHPPERLVVPDRLPNGDYPAGVDLRITLLGTAASVPTAARGTAATLISRGGDRWLVDCGEGTQRQFLRSGLGLVDLDAVLITHPHGDHYLGLPGLLKTYGLRGRERPLPVLGPPGLLALLARLGPLIGRLPFPLEARELDPGAAVAGQGWRIDAIATRHSVPSLGYALVEDPRPGAFDPAAARALGVPEGPAWGTLQRGAEVPGADGRAVRPSDVMGPARAGRTVVVTGDTEPCATVLAAARGGSVLVHEATFLHAERDRARETRHSTAREAARLAREADVALLVLTHLSSRCPVGELRDEAEREFDRVLMARDFTVVEVPFPERGAPVVHPPARPDTVRQVAEAARAVSSTVPATVPTDDL